MALRPYAVGAGEYRNIMDRSSKADPTEQASERRTRWISQGLEKLIESCASDAARGQRPRFDVVIVGSGYGGAVAADRLSGLQKSVCVLERGREYMPGAFPGRMSEVGGHVRFTSPGQSGAKGRMEGLFDVRVGADISVLVANGVGGGSLINAGVMEFPAPGVFDEKAWPKELPDYGTLLKRAMRLREELGAGADGAANSVGPQTFGAELLRQQAMRRIGGRAVPITVALKPDHVTSGQVQLCKCIACGDCASGCNHSAKDSLDVNLLRRAVVRGSLLYAGATVSRIRRIEGDWELEVWHTDAVLRKRMAEPLRLRASTLILAAGTLGSTEILLRSQTDELRFSHQLGRRFSGNGDVLAAVYDARHPINGIADEDSPPKSRLVGPTITAMVEQRNPSGDGFVVQDLAVPGPLRRLFEEAFATSSLLHQLESADNSDHDPGDTGVDPCAVDSKKIGRSMAVALIGRDEAAGVMTLLPDSIELPLDAGVLIDWKKARDDKRIVQSQAALANSLDRTSSGLGGQVLPNPMWQLLPAELEQMLDARKGPLLTVHPLGGCAMGVDREHGVVNAAGQVFSGSAAAKDEPHSGLFVLDGSIIPTSLGINPALTIATLADLAVERLAAEWPKPAETPAEPKLERRPLFRVRPVPEPALETKVQVIERLAGLVELGPTKQQLWVELDIVYADRALFPRDKPADLSGHLLPIRTEPELSRVRVFADCASKYDMTRPDKEALLVAPLLDTSTLRFFHRERSTFRERRCRAWWSWLRNRGARDSFQALADGIAGRGGELSAWKRLKQSLKLASRAGEVRLFSYDLELDVPTQATGLFENLSGRSGLRISGQKRLTYERRCSPWAQLMRMDLDHFADLELGEQRRLEVCPVYFAQKGIPLMRLVQQQAQPSALVDLAAFTLYVVRVLINVHLWSFRKPDRAHDRLPQRLPGRLKGIPAPEIHELIPEGATEGVIRLTRYRLAAGLSKGPPALLIHGYSASGTTFAHTAVEPNLASHLWRSGIEPWIVELRTSCAMPTAVKPWTFEQIALADVPAAVRFVCAATGVERIDVVSHCMGSAMFAMTLLANDARAHQVTNRIRRWVMSQIGPAMLFSPANIFRSYLIRYVRHLLPNFKYSLRAGEDAPGFDADMFDRLIASMPYLDDANERRSEFDVENPSWWMPWRRTPWVGTRHRLDALIGRTFDVRRMDPEVLERIDDFFGPINLTTISQPIHFARRVFVTANDGLENWGSHNLRRLAHMRMLSLHGRSNGLADWETGLELLRLKRDNGLSWEVRFLENRGHQDCMIGSQGTPIFELIREFLAKA